MERKSSIDHNQTLRESSIRRESKLRKDDISIGKGGSRTTINTKNGGMINNGNFFSGDGIGLTWKQENIFSKKTAIDSKKNLQADIQHVVSAETHKHEFSSQKSIDHQKSSSARHSALSKHKEQKAATLNMTMNSQDPNQLSINGYKASISPNNQQGYHSGTNQSPRLRNVILVNLKTKRRQVQFNNDKTMSKHEDLHEISTCQAKFEQYLKKYQNNQTTKSLSPKVVVPKQENVKLYKVLDKQFNVLMPTAYNAEALSFVSNKTSGNRMFQPMHRSLYSRNPVTKRLTGLRIVGNSNQRSIIQDRQQQAEVELGVQASLPNTILDLENKTGGVSARSTKEFDEKGGSIDQVLQNQNSSRGEEPIPENNNSKNIEFSDSGFQQNDSPIKLKVYNIEDHHEEKREESTEMNMIECNQSHTQAEKSVVSDSGFSQKNHGMPEKISSTNQIRHGGDGAIIEIKKEILRKDHRHASSKPPHEKIFSHDKTSQRRASIIDQDGQLRSSTPHQKLTPQKSGHNSSMRHSLKSQGGMPAAGQTQRRHIYKYLKQPNQAVEQASSANRGTFVVGSTNLKGDHIKQLIDIHQDSQILDSCKNRREGTSAEPSQDKLNDIFRSFKEESKPVGESSFSNVYLISPQNEQIKKSTNAFPQTFHHYHEKGKTASFKSGQVPPMLISSKPSFDDRGQFKGKTMALSPLYSIKSSGFDKESRKLSEPMEAKISMISEEKIKIKQVPRQEPPNLSQEAHSYELLTSQEDFKKSDYNKRLAEIELAFPFTRDTFFYKKLNSLEKDQPLVLAQPYDMSHLAQTWKSFMNPRVLKSKHNHSRDQKFTFKTESSKTDRIRYGNRDMTPKQRKREWMKEAIMAQKIKLAKELGGNPEDFGPQQNSAIAFTAFSPKQQKDGAGSSQPTQQSPRTPVLPSASSNKMRANRIQVHEIDSADPTRRDIQETLKKQKASYHLTKVEKNPKKKQDDDKESLNIRNSVGLGSYDINYTSRMKKTSVLGEEQLASFKEDIKSGSQVMLPDDALELRGRQSPMCYIITTDRSKNKGSQHPQSRGLVSTDEAKRNQQAIPDNFYAQEGTIIVSQQEQIASQDDKTFSFREPAHHPEKQKTYVTIQNQQEANPSVHLQNSSWNMNSKSASMTAQNSIMSNKSRQVAFSNLKLQAKNTLYQDPNLMSNSVTMPMGAEFSIQEPLKQKTKDENQGSLGDSLDQVENIELDNSATLRVEKVAQRYSKLEQQNSPPVKAEGSRVQSQLRGSSQNQMRASPQSRLSLGKRKVSGFAGGVIGAGVDSQIYHNKASFNFGNASVMGKQGRGQLQQNEEMTDRRLSPRSQEKKVEVLPNLKQAEQTQNPTFSKQRTLSIETPDSALPRQINERGGDHFGKKQQDKTISLSFGNTIKPFSPDSRAGDHLSQMSRSQNRWAVGPKDKSQVDTENTVQSQQGKYQKGQPIKFALPIGKIINSGLESKKKSSIETDRKFLPLNMKEIQLQLSVRQMQMTAESKDEPRDRSPLFLKESFWKYSLKKPKFSTVKSQWITDRGRPKRNKKVSSQPSHQESRVDQSIHYLYKIQKNLWNRYQEEWDQFTKLDHTRAQPPVPPSCKNLTLHVYMQLSNKSTAALKPNIEFDPDIYEEAYKEAKRRLQLCSFRIFDHHVFLAMKYELEEGYEAIKKNYKMRKFKHGLIMENSEEINQIMDTSLSRPTPNPYESTENKSIIQTNFGDSLEAGTLTFDDLKIQKPSGPFRMADDGTITLAQQSIEQ